MKTSLTLSAVLFALTLTPSAFANDGAQEQKQEAVAADARATSVIATDPVPATPSLTRAALESLDVDVRQNLIGSLRDSAMLVLQLAVPALLDAASVGADQLKGGSR